MIDITAENAIQNRFTNEASSSRRIVADMRNAAEIENTAILTDLLADIEQRWCEMDQLNVSTSVSDQRLAVRQAFADVGIRIGGGSSG